MRATRENKIPNFVNTTLTGPLSLSSLSLDRLVLVAISLPLSPSPPSLSLSLSCSFWAGVLEVVAAFRLLQFWVFIYFFSSSRASRRNSTNPSDKMTRMPLSSAPVEVVALVSNWWDEINDSTNWQDGIFFTLCAAYALVSSVALVLLFSFSFLFFILSVLAQ